MRHTKREIELNEHKGSHTVLVLSDTHGHVHPGLTDLVAAFSPACIVHAGDVGGLEVLDTIRSWAPTVAVRGNVDSRSLGLADIVTVALSHNGATLLKMLVTHIALARIRLGRDVRQLAKDEKAGLVVCGHSHMPWIGMDGPVAVLNPGSAGPKRTGLPTTAGLIHINKDEIRMEHRDCASGQVWMPQAP